MNLNELKAYVLVLTLCEFDDNHVQIPTRNIVILESFDSESDAVQIRNQVNLSIKNFYGDRWIDATKEHSTNSTKLNKPNKCLHCSNYSLYEDQDSILGDIDLSISEINPMAKEYMNLYNQLEKEFEFIDSSLGKLTDSMLPLFKSLVDVETAKIKPRTIEQKNVLEQAIRTSLESINQDIKKKNDEGFSHIEIEIQRMLGNADDIDSRISDIDSDSKKFEKITGEECTYCQGHEVIDDNSRALDVNCQDNINYRSRDKNDLNKVANGYYNIKIDVEEFINKVNEYWSKIEEEHKL